MPRSSPDRCPGIRFVSEPPPLPEFLPRMDIAVFVGFASRGPLTCRWQSKTRTISPRSSVRRAPGVGCGRAARSSTHTSRRLSERSSGTAARAAGSCVWPASRRPTSSRSRGSSRAIGGTITPAFARATSPGSWSDGFRVGCTASVQPVGVGAARADGEGVAVDALVTAGTLLVRGDILRLHTASHLGFLPVDAAGDGPVSSPPSDRLSRTVIGRPVWFRTTPPALSPPTIATATVFTARREPDGIRNVFALQAPVVSWMADTDGATVRLDLRIDIADAPQSGALLSVAFGSQELWLTVHDVGVRADSADPGGDIVSLRGRGLWRLPSGAAVLPEPVVACDRVRLDLWVQETAVRTLRLGDLGLAPAHPRYWARLQDDNGRYHRDDVQGRPIGAGELSAERHFPLAGGSPDAIYLPLDVSLDPDRLLGAARQPRSPLERDGLSTFGAALFVDLELVSSTTDSLMDAGDHLQYRELFRGVLAASMLPSTSRRRRSWRFPTPVTAGGGAAPTIRLVPRCPQRRSRVRHGGTRSHARRRFRIRCRPRRRSVSSWTARSASCRDRTTCGVWMQARAAPTPSRGTHPRSRNRCWRRPNPRTSPTPS